MIKRRNDLLQDVLSSKRDDRTNIFDLINTVGVIAMKKLLKSILDDSKSLQERSFTLLFAIALSALFVMFLVGIIIGESITDIAMLGGGFVFFFLLAYLSIRYGKVKIGAPIAGLLIILVLLPVTFFTGGGIYGGSPIWFVFCILFVSLVVDGVIKYLLLGLSIVVATICYGIAYLHPETVTEHDVEAAYVDSYISLIIVCGMMSLMVGFEIWILNREKERSDDKTKEIEEMNKAQSKFFSSMSHEIRTPINTIIGLNEMTLRENAGPEVAENSRNIQAASKILLSLINDILDMSKIESGKMDIVKVQYDVGKMLSEIVNMIWIKANEKGLEFSISVDPSMPAQLFADEVRIKQILINLLNNAIKYTPEGSVTLSVHCVRTGSGKALVTYSVEDTGMGIRKENIPHLFDAFRREDTEKNRYIEGTGLGLSIVKQLVDLMGGTISVNSVYTKGSTFEVELEQEIADESIIGEFKAGNLHSANEHYDYHQSFEAPEAKVLVVDDNSTNLLVVKKLLKDTKVQITLAESGAACLEHTAQEHFDVILMDHLMPEMDGIECMHAVKDQPGGLSKATPIVALTANAGSENQALYRREGFDEYLVKPVDPGELENVIQKLLPQDMVSHTVEEGERYESDKIVREMRKKVPVIITTESMADLPTDILSRLNIPIISCRVQMDRGLFYDGEETGSDGIVRYMEDETVNAKSEAPSVAEYEQFFSEVLTKAQHIVHITTAKHASESYVNACEAALSFYNVRVFDSGNLSSGTGLLALFGYDMAESGSNDAKFIVEKLKEKRKKIEFSFIIRTTEYLRRGGRLSAGVSKLCDALMLHPVIDTKDFETHTKGIIAGDYERVKRKYITSVLKNPDTIDKSVLFITYVGMRMKEVEKVKEEALALVPFEQVYLTKAAPSIAINCGPGTFGLIFARK